MKYDGSYRLNCNPHIPNNYIENILIKFMLLIRSDRFFLGGMYAAEPLHPKTIPSIPVSNSSAKRD